MREFDKAYKAKVFPRLTALGFERGGGNHVRRDEGRVHVIRVQQHGRNSTAWASACLNLMTAPSSRVSVEESFAWGGSRAGLGDSAFPDQQGRHVIRLGWLTPARTDLWYDYQPQDAASVDSAVVRMLDDLELYGLPWLAAPMSHGPRRWTVWDQIGWTLWSRMPPMKPGREGD